MSAPSGTGGRRPYRRPMRGWWRRDPFFVRYMLRELTALAVAAYAIVLLIGVLALGRGEAAWDRWLAMLRSPLSLALHGLLLLAMGIHTWTWFGIMPKTLPALYLGGRRVAGRVITLTGLAAAAVASAALLALAWALRP